MSASADFVVAGAGHNSLITAAYLARAGYEVLVLDARPIPGGGAASEEMLGPGYSIDSCSTGHTLIQTNPLLIDDELDLIGRYGLTYIEPDPFSHVAFPDGEQLTMWLDRERSVEELDAVLALPTPSVRAPARRLRRGQAPVRSLALHPARIRPAARGAARRPPRGLEVAPAAEDERLGRDPPRVREPIRALVHALAGVPDPRPRGRGRLRAARLLDRVRPPAPRLDDPAGRLGRAHRGARSLDRRRRRHGALRPGGLAAAARGRPLRRSRDGGGGDVQRPRGGGLDDPRQAPGRDGAGRRLGRGLRLRGRDLRRRALRVRRLHGGDAAAGVRDPGRGPDRGLGRADRLAAGAARSRAPSAGRRLRPRPGLASGRHPDPRRPVAGARGSSYGQVPQRPGLAAAGGRVGLGSSSSCARPGASSSACAGSRPRSARTPCSRCWSSRRSTSRPRTAT